MVSTTNRELAAVTVLLAVLAGSCLLGMVTTAQMNGRIPDSSVDMAASGSGSQDSSSSSSMSDVKNSGSGSSMSASGALSIEDNLLLAYSTREERDRSVEWIRRLWAFIFHTDVKNVRVMISRDIPLPSGYLQNKNQGHNMSYTVVVNNAADSLGLDSETYKRQFQELLPASTTSYLVTFPQGQVPDRLNLTVIDQIRSPSPVSTKGIDQDNVKTFMIYDTISFSYRNMAERNRILEIVRRAWETALGQAAMNVDLVVHQDVVNSDGTHQFSYVITVLTSQMDWNVQQLERKVRQVLSSANIPSLVIPDSTDSGSTQPFADNGVRSYVFYDTVTMTYSTDAQRLEAVETLRKTWQQVFGSDAWNVQVSVHADKPAKSTATNARRVSYSIMFSSQNKSDWNFNTLQQQFLSMLGSPSTKTGEGFSFVTMKSRGRDDSNDDSDGDEDSESSGTDSTSSDSAGSDDSDSDSGPQGRALNYKRSKTSRKSITSKTVTGSNTATEHYFLSDAIRMVYSSKNQRDQTLETIRSMWADVLGDAADQVEISMNDDFAPPGSQKHNVHYHILVESSQSGLNLNSYSSTFWSMVSKSDKVILQTASRVLVLPYIQGSLDLNAVQAEQEESQVSKKGSVSYQLPYIKVSLDRKVASSSNDNNDQSADQSEETSGSQSSHINSEQRNDLSQSSSQTSKSNNWKNGQQSMIKFSIQDTQIIAYSTSEELDENLDSLKSIWIQVLGGDDDVQDVSVKLLMDINSNGGHAVTYRISGLGSKRYDVAQVMGSFLKALTNTNFSWIKVAQTKTASAVSPVGYNHKSAHSTSQQTQQSQSSQSSEDNEDNQEDSSSDTASSYGQMQAATTKATIAKAAKIFFGKAKNNNQASSSYQKESQKVQESNTEEQVENSSDSSSEDSKYNEERGANEEMEKATTKRYRTTKAQSKIFFNKANEQKNKFQSDSASNGTIQLAKGQIVDTLRDAIEVTAGTRAPWMTSKKLVKSVITKAPTSKTIDDSDSSEDSSSESQMESPASSKGSYSNKKSNQMSSSVESSSMNQNRGSDRTNEVSIRGALSIRYSSKSERTSAIEDIKKRWLSSEALGDVDDVQIQFISEIFAPQWAQLGPENEVHTLVYVITGVARRPLDEKEVRHVLRRQLVDAKVDYIVLSAQQDGNDETIDDWATPPSGDSTSSAAGSGANSKAVISNSESSSSLQVGPINTYLIYDTLMSIKSNDDDAISAYIEQVNQAWAQVIGNDSDHHLVLYDNQTSGAVRTMKYMVVIMSGVADLDLVNLKSQFSAIKPASSGSVSQSTSSSKRSSAVVLRDSISLAYSSHKERDDFVDGIEKLWQSALGNNFQHVEAWLFDERVIETLLETEQAPGKTFSQLSYAVVVVSDKYQLSVNALEAAFQQYLITKSVNAAKIKACAFQDALAA